MMERLLLAITLTFLVSLTVESNSYTPTSMFSVVQLPAHPSAKFDTVLLKGNN
jgi:hypothetical protein